MINYRQLTGLPKPVVGNAVNIRIGEKQSYVQMVRDYETVLSAKLLEFFQQLGLTPSFCSLFGEQHKQESGIWIHSDILWKDDRWVKLPFGINWELIPSDTHFSWWDTGTLEECYPESTANTEWCQTDGFEFGQQGIHYGARENNSAEGCECIEQLKMEFMTPYLVRADVAHSVEYTTTYKHRIGVSVRFPVEQVPTWERALEIFEPYFKK
jgi:hypothetical protein